MARLLGRPCHIQHRIIHEMLKYMPLSAPTSGNETYAIITSAIPPFTRHVQWIVYRVSITSFAASRVSPLLQAR